MDIDLARTFLAVAETGSFHGAADRLNLTQAAISARIRALEEQLGGRLFIRNKTGARPTAAGHRFMRHAGALVQIWEDARRQVALLPGQGRRVSMGCQPGLWTPLLADWLAWMRRANPQLALQAQIDTPSRLIARILDGSLNGALLYDPPRQPNLVAELLIQDRLVMITSAADGSYDPGTYVHVDWGTAFNINLQSAFPDLARPAVTVSLGQLGLHHLRDVGGSGYFPLRAVESDLAQGTLWRVQNAPAFAHTTCLVHAEQGSPDLEIIRAGFSACLQEP